MRFIDNLIVGDGAKRKKKKIIWKIKHNAGMIDVYIIALSINKNALLDIINSSVLLQKKYPKNDMVIVGIAKGYDEAVDLVVDLVENVYKKTGKFDVSSFIET